MQAIDKLDKEELFNRIREYEQKYARLISITAVDTGNSLELIYVFENELNMEAFKVEVPKGSTFSSISSIYPGAMLAENEIQDLFGLKFDQLTIDFEGYMFLSHDSPQQPFIKEIRTKGAMKEDEG